MATILDLARYADVSAENVLRVLNGDPVSVDVAERVRSAIEALGSPRWPSETAAAVEPASTHLPELRRPENVEPRLAMDVGGIVYEAVRVEVRPVSQNLREMQVLVDRLVTALERMGGNIEQERQERLEDVALVTELLVTGWRNVDRRLGRLERMLERQQRTGAAEERGQVVRHVHIDAAERKSQ